MMRHSSTRTFTLHKHDVPPTNRTFCNISKTCLIQTSTFYVLLKLEPPVQVKFKQRFFQDQPTNQKSVQTNVSFREEGDECLLTQAVTEPVLCQLFQSNVT